MKRVNDFGGLVRILDQGRELHETLEILIEVVQRKIDQANLNQT